jgi:hypothetical protein
MNKIIKCLAEKLLSTALFFSNDKQQAANMINEIWDEALRQLWRAE